MDERVLQHDAEEENEREILWVTQPGHPIVKDIDDHFVLPGRHAPGNDDTSGQISIWPA